MKPIILKITLYFENQTSILFQFMFFFIKGIQK